MYLKKIRIAATRTQVELANQLKVRIQFVSDWERGLCAPPDHCFQQALDILKVDRHKVVDVMVAFQKRN